MRVSEFESLDKSELQNLCRLAGVNYERYVDSHSAVENGRWVLKRTVRGTLYVKLKKIIIAAGNCMPGTMNFCNKLFAKLGKEIESISLSELRKYGRLFGVETYAERVVRYMLAR